MAHPLVEQSIRPTSRPLTETARRFLHTARQRFDTVKCFEFVPSNYEMAWNVLDALPRGRFCEWGSGFGVVAGLAQLLGFEASGIECDGPLAEASRQLLQDCGLPVPITTGSYLELPCTAETVFVYCWPSRIGPTEQYFARHAPTGARLLICYGQDDIRGKVRDIRPVD